MPPGGRPVRSVIGWNSSDVARKHAKNPKTSNRREYADVIQLENVTKSYQTGDGPVHAVSDLSLEIPKGRFVAVCGPSGCGKSTLLMLVGTLITPTSGTVRIAGVDPASMSGASRARFRGSEIGFVFQMFHLLPYLTVRENILAAALPGSKVEAATHAGELLGKFGLGPRANHRPAELSAGERQRTAIARALINRPGLLLADEPTGNLDPASAGDVLDLLEGFHREGGTVLLVTHDPLAAERAEETIRLDAGRIAMT